MSRKPAPVSVDREALRPRLQAGLAAMGLALAPAVVEGLLRYLELLYRWNATYNLTAVRDPAEAVERHLLDSLSLLPHLAGPRVLDVGSGAGLPGIPLALARPDLRFVLLDAALKRTRFLTQAQIELPLPNVDVVQARIEDYRAPAPFQTITARAWSSARALWTDTAAVRAPGARVIAMKSADVAAELAGLSGLPLDAARHPGHAGRTLLVLSGRTA